MPDKDEPKKKKKRRPRKRTPEEEGIGRRTNNVPYVSGRSKGQKVKEDSREPFPIKVLEYNEKQPASTPLLTGKPDQQLLQQPASTPLLPPVPQIDEGAFIDELPTELDMTFMYIDDLMKNSNFGFATLSVLRYVFSNEMKKDKERTIGLVNSNAEEINKLLQKIAYGRYDDESIVTSANQIINMVSENPDEYLEMVNEAARYDYEVAFGLKNEYKN